MWIDKHHEVSDIRLEAVVKSKSLDTHSRMQALTKKDKEDIKKCMEYLLEHVAILITTAEERIKKS